MQTKRVVYLVAAFAAVSLLLVLTAQQALTPSGQFSSDPPMSAARQGAASTVLADGRILVTGGHIAVALKDGRVLVAGGTTTGGAVTNAAEVYTGVSWTPISAMLVARAGATATLLNDGRVILAGGSNGTSALASIDVFDPQTGAIAPFGTMSAARQGLSATTLMSEKFCWPVAAARARKF